MLDQNMIKKIEDFVYQKPRSVQEIAQHIGKSWRTADRYISEIEQDLGTVSTRTFREGTRGALKIVFWSAVEKVSSSIFQERMEKEIDTFKRKEDFCAFDIFQQIPDKNKKARIQKAESEEKTDASELEDFLTKTQKQLLVFAGNLSFINLKNKDTEIFKVIENLAKNKVSIKILCRVDLTGRENIERILAINFKLGSEIIEIRHAEQPLRCLIIDNKFARLKEIKEPTGRIKELNTRTFISYTINDKEWVEWLRKIFWKLFSKSVLAQKRMTELKKLE